MRLTLALLLASPATAAAKNYVLGASNTECADNGANFHDVADATECQAASTALGYGTLGTYTDPGHIPLCSYSGETGVNFDAGTSVGPSPGFQPICVQVPNPPPPPSPTPVHEHEEDRTIAVVGLMLAIVALLISLTIVVAWSLRSYGHGRLRFATWQDAREVDVRLEDGGLWRTVPMPMPR